MLTLRGLIYQSKREFAAARVWQRRLFGNSYPQIIFMHVPKCAGSSVNHHLNGYFDSRIFGRSVRINDIQLRGLAHEQAIRKGQHAAYTYGHMSWTTMRAVGVGESVYVFTFLRDPMARLRSLYSYATRLDPARRLIAIGDKALNERLDYLSPLDFFQCRAYRIRFDIDNFMVRTFSGDLGVFPKSEQDWRTALEQAKDNLCQLDYVGFHERFDQCFNDVVDAIRLPRPARVPRKNVTSALPDRSSSKGVLHLNDDTKDAIEPLVRYDRKLFTWAQSRWLTAARTNCQKKY